MSSSFLNPYYYDNLDPDFYMYLTPEMEVKDNIDTVEKAYEYYLNNGKPWVPVRSTLLKDFNHNVYYRFYSSNILNDNYIEDNVRNAIIDDLERLSIIHYRRVGDSNPLFQNYKIDPNFNPYLYRVMHNVRADMPNESLYFDYLDKKESNQNIVVGNVNELTYHISSNLTVSIDNLVVDDTMTIKENLIVQKDAYILGNLGADSTGLMVDGGSIVVDNNFGRMEQLFSYNRMSSNSIELGETRIAYEIEDSSSNHLLNISGGNVIIDKTLNVNSNLIIETGQLMIGNGLVYDPSFSIQTDNNIKVNGVQVSSDERIKTNITNLDTLECLDKIKQVSIKSYNFKSENYDKLNWYK